MDCSTPGFPVLHHLPELAQTHVHRVRNAIQLSHLLSSPSPPTFNLSQHQGLFQWVLCIRWPKYWSFSFIISPSNEYSGLIPFRMDWLDLLAVQGTLKSLLQHHSSKASILWCSAFFMGVPHSSVGKESACSAGDLGLIPVSGRSPGEGNGNPLQYSCLENPMDRGAWQAIVHGVTRVGHDLVTKPPNHHSFLYSPTLTSIHDYWKNHSFD